MALRRAIPLTMRPKGLSDSIDGTNAFQGAMASLQNLIPSPNTAGQFVPRPGADQQTNFAASSIVGADQITALLVVGTIAYGMIASTSGTFAGKDVPFAYDVPTGAFLPILIPQGAAALPTTQPAVGDWEPPTMAQIETRILITHPGYGESGPDKFGWIDVSGFTDATHTGSTHSSTTIDTLSSNVLQAGWQPGQEIAGAGIPANTVIVSIAAGGLSLIMSNAATATAAGVALTVNGGSATTPIYAAGDTNINNLPARPVAVSNFNGRAYFAVPGAGTAFSDSLVPCQRTNASQALTPADGLDITAFGGLPVSQTQGGILQALICFQGVAKMQQITGDPALLNLAMNDLGVGVGCAAPNTICQSPLGLMFLAPDGLRVVDLLARVSEPIGANGQGVNQPFLFSVFPSRMAAAFNLSTYRVTVQNGAQQGQPVQEFWYDINLKAWTGPHTFPAALVQPYSNSFLLASPTQPRSLWRSDVYPSIASNYVENSLPMSWVYETALLPDNQQMEMNDVTEATLGMALSIESSVTVVAMNSAGNTLDTLTIDGPAGVETIWGAFIWGEADWLEANPFYQQYLLPWHQPIVFKQLSLSVAGASSFGIAIGNLYLRYQILGYVLQGESA